MGGIFISYRREDSQGEAHHLFDDLKQYFGDDRVFIDVAGIDPGKDFRTAIEGAVSACDVLITMIGKKWLGVNEAGKRRLDDPKDFVRLETSAALRRDIPVIPVLVQGAEMPQSEHLPDELEALAFRNAFELRHNRWNVDVAELRKALEKMLPANIKLAAEKRSRLSLSKNLIAIFALILVLAMSFLFIWHKTQPDLGNVWTVEESGWHGEWRRRDNTNQFDATWTSGPNKFTSLITVEINGDKVKAHRRDNQGGYECTYEGTLDQDTRKIVGADVCPNVGFVKWEATIN